MKLKLGMVGPSGAGKTLIANILGNEMNMESSVGRPPYRPTNSVRIVEFSVPNIDLRKYSTEVDVQIWEIGGNPRLKSIWPAVQLNLDGIILVYDTNNELQVRDMSGLHMHFVTHSNLSPAQCLIIGNQFRGGRESAPAKIVGVGPRVRHCAVNVDDDPGTLRDEFLHFLTGVAQFTIEQEHSTNNGGFMANEKCLESGGGDSVPLPVPQGLGMNYSRNHPHPPPQHQQDYDRQPNSAYYQPYADFHKARTSSKKGSRRKEKESYIGGGNSPENENGIRNQGGGADEYGFNIHKKSRSVK